MRFERESQIQLTGVYGTYDLVETGIRNQGCRDIDLWTSLQVPAHELIFTIGLKGESHIQLTGV